MKRSEMLILIANQLDFLNNKFEGFKTAYSNEELNKADVILTTIEDVGMLPPTIISMPDQYNRTDSTYGFEVNEWEPEEDDSKKAREELVKQAQELKMYDIHGTRQITIPNEDFDRLIEDLESDDGSK